MSVNTLSVCNIHFYWKQCLCDTSANAHCHATQTHCRDERVQRVYFLQNSVHCLDHLILKMYLKHCFVKFGIGNSIGLKTLNKNWMVSDSVRKIFGIKKRFSIEKIWYRKKIGFDFVQILGIATHYCLFGDYTSYLCTTNISERVQSAQHPSVL